MSLPSALEALKRKDFAAARDALAREDAAAFTIQHFLIKGLAELALQDWSAARETLADATLRFPDHALFWLNRGIAEENLGFIEAATESQQRCLALNPAQGEACGNLSNLYRKSRRFAEAEDMARRALANGAAKGDALNCLGLALRRQGKFAEADAALRQAQEAAPDNAAILANRANLAVDELRFDEAWPLFRNARAIKDEAVFRHDEGLARLLAGDYEKGWDLFETRLEMPGALRVQPACPRWRGEGLAGKKLLILAEQGFGDVIQFCRYGAVIQGGELVWAVPKNLVRLLAGNVRGSIVCENGVLPACDYYVPMMSLAGMLKNATPRLPYLTAPQTPTLPPGKHRLKIGLVWAGSRTHERDRERSVRLEQLAPIFDSAADFYAPFVGDALEEIGTFPVVRLDPLMTDFADTAALIRQMDGLITVDTAAAHLAGALGVKTFVLLTHCPDWRWGVSEETTKLYPSLTLLRQPEYGDWGSVIEKLAALLKSGF